jgi:glycosyltransferase involved in cell wall biosynthesis
MSNSCRRLVSIVIPTYRGERYLAAAIESCLSQTYRSIEVIVVDDCSPTPDAAIAEKYAQQDTRVRVVRRSENGMISRALNSGYQVAQGEFHSRLAQDDLFREDAIERLVKTLQQHPQAGLAYADMMLIDGQGQVIQPMPTERPEKALFPANRVGLCVMWPASVYSKVGGFDPRFDLSEDFEFFLRISRDYPLVKCEGVAPFFFRYHPDQGSITKEHKHDLARARAHVSHATAMWKRSWTSPSRLKSLLTTRGRLWLTQLGIYGRLKYDRKQKS